MSDILDYDFSLSNEELLEMCKKQDQDALRLLLRRHEKPVYNMLFRMLSNQEDAEEALAEVFVKVWRGAANFKGNSKFTTWLFRIAANTARDFLRSRKARLEIQTDDTLINDMDCSDRSGSSGNNPEKQAVITDEYARIVKAMSKLSEEDRLLVNLYHFQEMEYDEIARITGTPFKNLKVKLFRARQRLRKLCDDQEKDGSADEVREDTTESSGLRQGAAEWV